MSAVLPNACCHTLCCALPVLLLYVSQHQTTKERRWAPWHRHMILLSVTIVNRQCEGHVEIGLSCLFHIFSSSALDASMCKLQPSLAWLAASTQLADAIQSLNVSAPCLELTDTAIDPVPGLQTMSALPQR